MLGIIAAVLIVLWLLGLFRISRDHCFYSHCPDRRPHFARPALHEG